MLAYELHETIAASSQFPCCCHKVDQCAWGSAMPQVKSTLNKDPDLILHGCLQMWKDLEDRAREALGDAGQRVRDVEVSEAEASNMRMQADIAKRCAPLCVTNFIMFAVVCSCFMGWHQGDIGPCLDQHVWINNQLSHAQRVCPRWNDVRSCFHISCLMLLPQLLFVSTQDVHRDSNAGSVSFYG